MVCAEGKSKIQIVVIPAEAGIHTIKYMNGYLLSQV